MAINSTRLIDPDLPAAQQSASDKNINWLGASYSGADIKIVAHLYDSEDRNEELRELILDRNASLDLAKGFSNIAALPIITSAEASSAYPTSTDFLVKGAGLSADSPSRQEILDHYQSFKASPGLGKITAGSLSNIHTATARAQTSLIEQMQVMDENSSPTITLGSLQTISIQSHREKVSVRALGTTYVKGYTRGPRTIAGSLIFTVFDEHALKYLIRNMKGLLKKYGELDYYTTSMLPDQLPPIDFTIVFANEYGSISKMGLYGVEFINDGVTFSIEDLFSEQVINFVARDIDIMTSLGMVKLSDHERGMFATQLNGGQPFTASDLYFANRNAYNAYLDRLGMRRRFRNR